MSSITEKLVVLSVCLAVVIPAANAATVTLAGEGVTIRYEDKAAGVIGAPSLIATSLITSPASFAGIQAAEAAAAGGPVLRDASRERYALSVSSVARNELPSSFAEGMALRFSLGEGDEPNPGFNSLLLAGLGLFALIARQRIAALSRAPHSPVLI